ncbi:MAG TPA: hypothetical protein VFS19_04995, partial [Planctomycetota bacterium]|nr:hypothetical protein [Planctomycetota bacterium]
FLILDSRFQEPEAEKLTLTGSLRLEFFARESSIEELRARASGLPPPRGDDTFLPADVRIRLDARAADLRFSADLAVLPYDDGSNQGLGDGGRVLLKQLFADLEISDLTFRAGAFEYAWRIRPHGEPFLLDLGRSESFFSGAGDRDVEQAAGALVKWRAGDFVEVEALWMTALEAGPASRDETPAALLVNFPLSERSAVFLGALHVAGGGSERVTTWGGGTDWYFGDDRELELFGEAWIQSGRIASGVSRRAWAAHAGARAVTGPWRAELSASRRSGDDDPADGRDRTFQSYEGQERLRIVESAEFGLDWDVNVSSIRFSLVRRLGESAEARIDAARFRLAESMPGLDRDLGIEVDATVSHEISKATTAWIAVAALFGSDTLESATIDRESDTFLAAVGLKTVW